MRPEQFRAVEQTRIYFEQALKEEPNRVPKFLWNAKMKIEKVALDKRMPMAKYYLVHWGSQMTDKKAGMIAAGFPA